MDNNCTEQIVSEDYFDFNIEYNSTFTTEMDDPSICYTTINNIFSVAHVPNNLVTPELIQFFGPRIYPSCLGLLDIGSLEASSITRVRSTPTLNLFGEGVLIGIIDTGIEYTHQAFRYADGSSKIASIWDQTIDGDNAPEGFPYGSEYLQAQINTALQSEDPLSIVPSTDENGHGTFLAGIAAGMRDDSNNFSGVATDSELLIVKLKPAKNNIRDFYHIPHDVPCYQDTDLMIGVEYLYRKSLELQRPISICIGLGTSLGSHDGRGTLSRYISQMADHNGVSIAVAAGNEGNRGLHYYGEITEAEEFETIELLVAPGEIGFTMELWGRPPNIYSIDILSPTGEYIPRIPARLGESRVIRFIFEETIINVDYFLVESQTGDELILLRFQTPTEGLWRFRVYSNINLPSSFHIWLSLSNFLNEGTAFITSNPDTTLTDPANALLSIVSTGYDYINQNLYINSSRGFTRDNRFLPDFAAPGVNLIGPGLQNTYTTRSGTSVAAAHTTGVAALVLEWGIVDNNFPRLDSIDINNFLKRGARRDPSTTYPSTSWGYGILDLYGAFNSFRE